MIEPTSNLGMDDEAQPSEWKQEIASRLDTYRTKNKRKLTGDFSMRFNFDGEPAAPRQQICVPALPEIEIQENEAAPEPSTELSSEEAPLTAAEEPESLKLPDTVQPSQPAPLRPSVPFKRKIVMEANVIEFPRLFPPEPPPSNVLAEPVRPSVPRILDAPEIAEPLLENPILEGMRLEQLEHEPAPVFELPLQVASAVRRVYASLADGLVVLLASGIFFTIVYKMLPGVEWTKPLAGTLAAVPVVFWAVYQYMFVVYGARTPGMAIMQLAFSTFHGTAPNLHQRKMRLLGMALSCSSLLLGFFWAFFDEDMLCWHDRISRTYCFRQKS